jgi:hypothetical protein
MRGADRLHLGQLRNIARQLEDTMAGTRAQPELEQCDAYDDMRGGFEES